jgi:hypothetical protein
MSYRPIRRATEANAVRDRRLAGPLGALTPALAVVLLAAAPALARPHGSPDLTPSLFLPRHPDFELLSLVDCLSGPCIGSTAVAQLDDAEPAVPATTAPAVAGPGSAGPAVAQGGNPQRPAGVERPAAGAAAPVLDAAALGAAGALSTGAVQLEADLRPVGAVEHNRGSADELGATGEVGVNVALAPDFAAGAMTENTGAGEDQRAAGELLVASLPENFDLRLPGEIENNTVSEDPTSRLLSLHGRQAALDEAFGVGGLASGQVLGLRRLSLTSPNTTRTRIDGSPQAPVRMALHNVGPAPAEIVVASHGPMDSDEREAIHRHRVDRRPEPEAPAEELRAPGAPAEQVAVPVEPAVPLEPRAPGKAAPAGPGGGGGATSPQLSSS